MKTELMHYRDMIGKKVVKKSHRPFKSNNKINTVTGVVVHPYKKDTLAYSFKEDLSFVSCDKCKEYYDKSKKQAA